MVAPREGRYSRGSALTGASSTLIVVRIVYPAAMRVGYGVWDWVGHLETVRLFIYVVAPIGTRSPCAK
eukprot:7351289-Prymnesium_polylepis.2